MKITFHYDISKTSLCEWEEDDAWHFMDNQSGTPGSGRDLPSTSLLSGERIAESLRIAGVRVTDFHSTEVPRFVRLAVFDGFARTFTLSELTEGLAWIRQHLGMAEIRCSGFDDALRVWEESGQYLEQMSQMQVLHSGKKARVADAQTSLDDFENAFLRFKEYEEGR